MPLCQLTHPQVMIWEYRNVISGDLSTVASAPIVLRSYNRKDHNTHNYLLILPIYSSRLHIFVYLSIFVFFVCFSSCRSYMYISATNKTGSPLPSGDLQKYANVYFSIISKVSYVYIWHRCYFVDGSVVINTRDVCRLALSW